MWDLVSNTGTIEQSVSRLPSLYADADGVQHNPRALADNGHTAEVNALGWYARATAPAPAHNADTHRVNTLAPVFDAANSRTVEAVEVVPRPLPDVVELIKAIAGRKILAIAPEWKQRNMIARSLELERIERTTGTLTAQEQAQLDAMQTVWTRIKALRAHSDALEAAVTADINTDIRAGWPE